MQTSRVKSENIMQGRKKVGDILTQNFFNVESKSTEICYKKCKEQPNLNLWRHSECCEGFLCVKMFHKKQIGAGIII